MKNWHIPGQKVICIFNGRYDHSDLTVPMLLIEDEIYTIENVFIDENDVYFTIEEDKRIYDGDRVIHFHERFEPVFPVKHKMIKELEMV